MFIEIYQNKGRYEEFNNLKKVITIFKVKVKHENTCYFSSNQNYFKINNENDSFVKNKLSDISYSRNCKFRFFIQNFILNLEERLKKI